MTACACRQAIFTALMDTSPTRTCALLQMKSYEHMGVMGVEVRAVGQPTCTSATLPMEPRLLNSTSVDLLWTSHSSMGRTHHLNIGTAFPQGACLLINVTVMPTSRAENKVKLLGFTVF